MLVFGKLSSLLSSSSSANGYFGRGCAFVLLLLLVVSVVVEAEEDSPITEAPEKTTKDEAPQWAKDLDGDYAGIIYMSLLAVLQLVLLIVNLIVLNVLRTVALPELLEAKKRCFELMDHVLVASLPPGLVPIIGTPVPGDDDKGAPVPTPRKMATKTGEGKSAAGGTSGK